MTQPLRLRFTDEAQAIVVLATWFRHPPFTDDNGNEIPAGWIRDGLKHTLRDIGVIILAKAPEDDEGFPIGPPTYARPSPEDPPYWHCDIKFRPGHPDEATIHEVVADYVVTPGNPKHDFS